MFGKVFDQLALEHQLLDPRVRVVLRNFFTDSTIPVQTDGSSWHYTVISMETVAVTEYNNSKRPRRTAYQSCYLKTPKMPSGVFNLESSAQISGTPRRDFRYSRKSPVIKIKSGFCSSVAFTQAFTLVRRCTGPKCKSVSCTIRNDRSSPVSSSRCCVTVNGITSGVGITSRIHVSSARMIGLTTSEAKDFSASMTGRLTSEVFRQR